MRILIYRWYRGQVVRVGLRVAVRGWISVGWCQVQVEGLGYQVQGFGYREWVVLIQVEVGLLRQGRE